MKVGSTIIITMILETGAIHAPNFAIWAFYALRRKCDRGCRSDIRKTKKIFQEDYEDIYKGPEFSLDFRLA